MITLAFELSTDCGSLALLDGERVRHERAWREDPPRRQRLFRWLRDDAAAGTVRLDDVALYAVGLGPGGFAGLRAAVAAATALALPTGTPVYGLPSGEALAHDVLARVDADRVLVVGDARREQCWVMGFARAGDGVRMDLPLTLFGYAALADLPAGSGTVCVSPDWERLEARLAVVGQGGGGRLIRERQVPRAGTVGLLAARKVAAGVPSLPLAPIYMHPPVGGVPRSSGTGAI